MKNEQFLWIQQKSICKRRFIWKPNGYNNSPAPQHLPWDHVSVYVWVCICVCVCDTLIYPFSDNLSSGSKWVNLGAYYVNKSWRIPLLWSNLNSKIYQIWNIECWVDIHGWSVCERQIKTFFKKYFYDVIGFKVAIFKQKCI